MKSYLIGVALGISSLSASAATWVFAGFPTNLEFVAYYDIDSVLKKGSAVTVWTRLVYETPRKSGGSVVVIQTRYNCGNRTTDSLMLLQYDQSGNMINSSRAEFTGDPVIPSTFGEGMYSVFCKAGFPETLDSDATSFADPDASSKKLFQSDYWRDLKMEKSKKR